jgi:hypothetical protein
MTTDTHTEEKVNVTPPEKKIRIDLDDMRVVEITKMCLELQSIQQKYNDEESLCEYRIIRPVGQKEKILEMNMAMVRAYILFYNT